MASEIKIRNISIMAAKRYIRRFRGHTRLFVHENGGTDVLLSDFRGRIIATVGRYIVSLI